MKFLPLSVHAHCAGADILWCLSFGFRSSVRLSLCLSAMQASGCVDEAIVAEIDDGRQIDAIADRMADAALPPRDVAVELFDLLLTLAKTTPDDDCGRYLVDRMADWIVLNRAARVPNGNAA